MLYILCLYIVNMHWGMTSDKFSNIAILGMWSQWKKIVKMERRNVTPKFYAHTWLQTEKNIGSEFTLND